MDSQFIDGAGTGRKATTGHPAFSIGHSDNLLLLLDIGSCPGLDCQIARDSPRLLRAVPGGAIAVHSHRQLIANLKEPAVIDLSFSARQVRRTLVAAVALAIAFGPFAALAAPQLHLGDAVLALADDDDGGFEIVPDEPAKPDDKKPADKKPADKKPEAKPDDEAMPDAPAEDAGDEGAPDKKPKSTKPEKGPAKKPTAKPATKPVTKPSAKPTAGGKKPAKPKLVDAKPDPLLPDICPVCLGCGYIPFSPRPAYVHMEGEPAPKPESFVPWHFCPKCQGERDPSELVAVEAGRLQNGSSTHANWEKKLGMKLVLVQTRHCTLHCQMTPEVAKRQGQGCEAAIEYIQRMTKSCFLTPPRPDNYEFLYLWDQASFNKAIPVCRGEPEFQGIEDWDLITKTAGFNGQLSQVANALEGKNRPPEHTVISNTAVRCIALATGNKAPQWMTYGFAYHTEFAVTTKILNTYVAYRVNDEKLGQDWPAEARKFVRERSMIGWKDIATLALADWNPKHHVAAFAMVSFLMKTDPVKFAKVGVLIKGGTEPSEAIEKMYGKPIDQLEAACNKWILTTGA